MAPFLVSFPFSLAPSLWIFSYCHSRVATRVFFFLYPFFFWFLLTFPFLLHIFFPFPSLLLWRPFSFPFFPPFPCFFLFRPSFLAPLLDPRGASARYAPPRIRHWTLCTIYWNLPLKSPKSAKRSTFYQKRGDLDPSLLFEVLHPPSKRWFAKISTLSQSVQQKHDQFNTSHLKHPLNLFSLITKINKYTFNKGNKNPSIPSTNYHVPFPYILSSM